MMEIEPQKNSSHNSCSWQCRLEFHSGLKGAKIEAGISGIRLPCAELGKLSEGDFFDWMSRGWALGSPEFRKELVREHRKRLAEIELGETDTREVRELQWKELLEECLRLLGKGEEAIRRDRKSAAWKVAVAAWMKKKTEVSNVWLAAKLKYGPSEWCQSLYRLIPF